MKRKNETFPPNLGHRKSGDIPAATWVCCPVCWRDHRRGDVCKCGVARANAVNDASAVSR